MKIFISWSGERSEALAKALRDWFPLVLHYVEPWHSQSDIQAGERWSVEIAKELENCNFGVICISRENLNSPWILFEAGALAKSMQDGRVIPLLLDLDFKEVSGPLAQFQSKKADNVGMKELVTSLNRASTSPVPDAQLEKLFPALWGDLEKQIAAIPKGTAPTAVKRPQGDILEELVSSVRNVEVRVREAIDDEPQFRRRRRIHRHPGMMFEIAHRLSDGPSDPMIILIAGSILRDDAPWMYELALDAYRSFKSGRVSSNPKAVQKFFVALDLLQRAPLAEEWGLDRMTLKILRSELFHGFRGSGDESDLEGDKLTPKKAV